MLDEVIIALVVINLLFSVWMLRVLSLQLREAIAQLDGMIAAAIKGLIEQGIGDFEPVNPIQAAIAQMLTQNLSRASDGPTASVIEVDVVRDAAGKFM